MQALLVLSIALAPGQIAVPVPAQRPPQIERLAPPPPVPYDFSAAQALLQAELANLSGRVAVIVRQGGRDLFLFQAGSIDYDTRTRMA